MTNDSVRDWHEAFSWAASARAAAASVVAQVRSGDVALAQAFGLADDDPLAGRVFAVKVFEVVPGIGKVRARRTMAAIGLAEDITLAAVPEPARSRIADEFAQLA